MKDVEFKEFMREITLRHERASRGTEAWLRVADERTQEMISKSDKLIEEVRALREDFRDEAKAHRAALFQILDRMNGGGAPPTTAQ